MFTAPIQDILTTRLQAMPQIIAGKNFKSDWLELVGMHIPRGRLALIDDTDTAIALGDALTRALKDRYECTHITLQRGVKADDEALAEIEARSSRADMLLAIGSGTISDLVKYASFKAGKPYLLFPTAASMNGYLSANASISIKGHKQSLAAALPQAVIADMGIIANAPTRLTQAGLGDSLARPTAQADWLMAHHLLGVTYDQTVYDIMKDYEAAVFEQSKALLHRDAEVIETLFALTLLSGLGMTMAKSSQPASGGEHMIGHAMEMATGKSTFLHGEEMSVTTLIASRHIESMISSFRRKPESSVTLLDPVFRRDDVVKYFGAENAAAFASLYAKKQAQIQAHFPNGEIPKASWEAAHEAVADIHIPQSRLIHIAMQASLPDKAEKIGWDEKTLNEIIPLTRFTRDRFSWLDLI